MPFAYHFPKRSATLFFEVTDLELNAAAHMLTHIMVDLREASWDPEWYVKVMLTNDDCGTLFDALAEETDT